MASAQAPYRLLTPAAFALVLFSLACLLQSAGAFDRIGHGLSELRATVLAHEIESDIVIVGIDSYSIDALGTWPWPRRFHARLLQQLEAAAPARVFFDIDFSSPAPSAGIDDAGGTGAAAISDDDYFERELARFTAAPVYLAAHLQARRGSDGEVSARRPLARFSRYAGEVSVMLEADADGIVRSMPGSTFIGDLELPAIFAVEREVETDSTFRIDFSIEPGSFGFISYRDLLSAEVDPASLAGKSIYVGAWSQELGDSIPVPRHRSLPGVAVQALASATLTEGRLRTLPVWVTLSLLAALSLASVLLFSRGGWRRNSILGTAALLLLLATSLLAYAYARVDVDVIPFAFVLVTAFVVTALRSLDYQTWRAMAFAIGFRRREALLRSVVETSMDAIICIDRNACIRTANPAASSMFLCPLRSLIGAGIASCIPDFPLDPESLSGGGLAREFLARDSSGRRFPVEATISRVAIDDEELFTAIIRDISERKQQEHKLEYQATHDPLTQLPNRTAVRAYLDDVLGDPSRHRRVAVLLLDLCRFKEVNDTLGHDVGDEVLRVVARRFMETLTDRAYIGRIGGDEFAVIVPEIAVRLAVESLTQNLVESLRMPIQVRGVSIEVGLSVGIAFWPDHAADAQELLRHADIAMYSAKRRAISYEYYSREDDQSSVRRLSMVSDLRSAIGSNAISLVYQPQVDLVTGQLAGVEALLRWDHPVHGRVSPEEFVAIAEATDLIRPLTEWVITEALRQRAAWAASGFDLRVAVNLSARALQDADFPGQLERILSRFGQDASALELEITETAMMLDPGRALAVVRDLLALGTRIAIDDFGTGYSSLGYLRDLRAHALKLDKSFVIDLDTREQNRVIVESTAQMANALGLEVVAEGVETESVSRYLASVGYRIGQGYWFGRPMSPHELIARYRGRIDCDRAAAALSA